MPKDNYHNDLGPEHLLFLHAKNRPRGGCKWYHAGYSALQDLVSGAAGAREQAYQARLRATRAAEQAKQKAEAKTVEEQNG
jgi:hypothetical protein